MSNLAMHITEMQKRLDTAKIWCQTVNLEYWKKDGTIINLNGWLVIGSHWRGGTHNMRNPVNGEVRKVRDINIFKFNNHDIYV